MSKRGKAMSYFSDGFTKNKLIVLYVLREHGLELTREQFTTLSGERELMPFFELQSAVSELEEEGLCTSDAQGAADVEMLKGRIFDFDPDAPMKKRSRASGRFAPKMAAHVLREFWAK